MPLRLNHSTDVLSSDSQ